MRIAFYISQQITFFNRKRIIIAVLALLSLACKNQGNLESYGLKKYEITLKSDDIADLNATIWKKKAITAKLYVEGREYQVLVNYAGKSTLDFPKKSIQIESQTNEFIPIRLSAQSVDSTMLRSYLGFYLFRGKLKYSPKIDLVSVYVNDKFLGLYLEVEHLNYQFFEAQGVKVGDLFKAQKQPDEYEPLTPGMWENVARTFDLKRKNAQEKGDFQSLRKVTEVLGKLDDNYPIAELAEVFDLDNLIDYLSVSAFLNNWDGIKNNYHLFRAENDKQFLIVPWDLDYIFPTKKNFRVYDKDSTIFMPSYLTSQIFKNSELKAKYLDKIRTLLSDWNESNIRGLVGQIAEKTQKAFESDVYLKRQNLSASQRVEYLMTYINEWHGHLKEELQMETSNTETSMSEGH